MIDLLASWIFVTSIISFASFFLCVWWVDGPERLPIAVTFFALAGIGATVGITAGLSRDGVVGDIMSAVLGIVSALSIWLFAADRTKGAIVSICSLTFSLGIFFGYFDGSSRRAFPESYNFWREGCYKAYTNKDILENPGTRVFLDYTIGEMCGEIFKKEKGLLFSETS